MCTIFYYWYRGYWCPLSHNFVFRQNYGFINWLWYFVWNMYFQQDIIWFCSISLWHKWDLSLSLHVSFSCLIIWLSLSLTLAELFIFNQNSYELEHQLVKYVYVWLHISKFDIYHNILDLKCMFKNDAIIGVTNEEQTC